MKITTKLKIGILAIFMAVGLPAVTAGDAAKIPISAFAQWPAMSDVALSSDGQYLAFTSQNKGRRTLIIRDLDINKQYLIPAVKHANLRWYRWVDGDRILLSYMFNNKRQNIRGTISETRLALYNLKKKKFR